jgi:hypothetical protein
MKYIKTDRIGRASLVLLALGGACSMLPAQIARGPEPVSAARPLLNEAVRLQRQFGKAITYEDAVWRWSGDVETNQRGGTLPKSLSYVRPADVGEDPGLILASSLAAYHQQTDGPRFAVITSKYGLHIVPTQKRDEGGNWGSVTSPLDAEITVPVQERTATEHLVAILGQVTSITRISVGFVPTNVSRYGLPDPFEWGFAADPSRFSWGASGTVARDAILDLLERSATTYSWHLNCDPGGPDCAFNIGALIVAEVGANGRAADKTVWYDRCGACDYVKSRPEPKPQIEYTPLP